MTICKYCKKTDHVIDNCTEIICKSCKKKGHPHWKCTNEKKDKTTSQDDKSNYIRNLNDVEKYKNSLWSEIK